VDREERRWKKREKVRRKKKVRRKVFAFAENRTDVDLADNASCAARRKSFQAK